MGEVFQNVGSLLGILAMVWLAIKWLHGWWNRKQFSWLVMNRKHEGDMSRVEFMLTRKIWQFLREVARLRQDSGVEIESIESVGPYIKCTLYGPREKLDAMDSH